MCMNIGLFSTLCNPAFNIHNSFKRQQAERNQLAAQQKLAAKEERATQKKLAAQRKRTAQRERDAQKAFAALIELAAQKEMAAKRQPPPTQFYQVKAMIEPYWRLFNSIMKNQRKNDIALNQGTLEGSNIPTIGMRLTSDPDLSNSHTTGIAHFPPEIKAQIMVGASKYNHCDYSIQLFLSFLEPLLREVGAKVEWFAVEVKPLLLFHCHPHLADPWIRHSVFNITTDRGEEFIADFTIEQFGYIGSWWFMEKKAYLAQCTHGLRIRQPSASEVECARNGEIKHPIERDDVAIAICRSGYLDDWMTYDEEERLWHMDEVVKEQFAHFEQRAVGNREMGYLGDGYESSCAGSESPCNGSGSQSTVFSSPSTTDAGSQSSQGECWSDTEYESQSTFGSSPFYGRSQAELL